MAPDRGRQEPVYEPLIEDREDNYENPLVESSRSSFSSWGDESFSQSTRQPSRVSTRNDSDEADGLQHFTLRSLFVGLAIGVLICFSNTYFGLQTGWISGMGMPAALIGFAFFKSISRCIRLPFSPVENVLVQTVAGAVGTMPLGCGFVGVVPALEFLLKSDENGPRHLSTWKLVLWSLGICFFGVVFAIPLRKEVIIREKLKFPTGTATALTIGVLHGNPKESEGGDGLGVYRSRSGSLDLLRSSRLSQKQLDDEESRDRIAQSDHGDPEIDRRGDWKANIWRLLYALALSAIYTLASFFIPQLRRIPVFGLYLGRQWLWNLNPSPAYVGQGIIMGPSITVHMVLGAIIGWGILSPVAKHHGWAPGPVGKWTSGSRGWIVWVSLAIMLADSLISLGWLILRPLIQHGPAFVQKLRQEHQDGTIHNLVKSITSSTQTSYTPLRPPDSSNTRPDIDAPPSQQIGAALFFTLLAVSIVIFFSFLHFSFPLFPTSYAFLALLLAVILSIMGVRAQGETDINPVSGISKLTQLVFALVTSTSNPNHIISNLLAGAISESGALQAGDMMQDLKTGHLLGASPRAQFYGQIVGSGVGAIVSALVYKLYVSVYEIPGDLFQIPTAYVWIFTARLVTGKGLPPMAWQISVGFGVVFSLFTCLRLWAKEKEKPWAEWIPGGIAVAVGMYNVPSFTLARFVGGVIAGWSTWTGKDETRVVVLASGLILGEGVGSILNLGLAGGNVPHLECGRVEGHFRCELIRSGSNI